MLAWPKLAHFFMEEKGMNPKSKSFNEIASNRFEIIAPLLDDFPDKATMLVKRKQIAEKYCISEKTVRRYLKRYRLKGYEGLCPGYCGQPGARAIPNEVIEEAITLRRENPKRSVRDIIYILEGEDKIRHGAVKKSTLQDQLSARGYSAAQMKIYQGYNNNTSGARRFQYNHRNDLWQSDIKYGPFIGKDRTYLVCFIDDCTRFILHSQFYFSQTMDDVADCFRQAILKYGTPFRILLDNGSQYRTAFIKRTCAKLGIRLIYCKPYACETKGKVEKFNSTLEAFIDELRLNKIDTLVALNRMWKAWLQEVYLCREHSSLPKGQSPEIAFNTDSEPLRLKDQDLITNAFLQVKKNRKVDKTGCVNFQGGKYSVDGGLTIVGRKVDIVYDNADLSIAWIECPGCPVMEARPLVIREKVCEKPKLPQRFSLEKPDYSRLLAVAEKKNEIRENERRTAISLLDFNQTPKQSCQTDAVQTQTSSQKSDEVTNEANGTKRTISFLSWKQGGE
jgi:transposase InsO family protein